MKMFRLKNKETSKSISANFTSSYHTGNHIRNNVDVIDPYKQQYITQNYARK